MKTKSTISYSFHGISDIGKIRDKNEDRFWINRIGSFFAVVDGMGGHNAGEVASERAIELMQIIFAERKLANIKREETAIKSLLIKGLNQINRKIYQIGQSENDYTGMGFTAAIVYKIEDIMYFCHVGDVRIYVCNEKSIRQIGNDHSYVTEKIKKGLMTREEARISSLMNRLTMALGMPVPVNPEFIKTVLNRRDCVLLCSDGLWGMLPEPEIHKIVVSLDNAREICERLVIEANNTGGEDNITIIVLLYETSD